MRILILALSLAFSASAAAADISWHADRMAPGSVMVMKDDAGAVTHVKRGTERGQHVFDTFAGQGRGATFTGSYTVNAQGNVTTTIAPDGAVTRYRPHRCNRTPGRCAYVMIHADGFKEPRTRVTSATRSGLTYEEYGLDGLMAQGALELDRLGAAKSGWMKRAQDRRKLRTTRVMIALK